MASEKQIFTVTEEHLKLMQRLNIRYSDRSGELGALLVDEETPFGNSSAVHDMVEILGAEKIETDDGETVYPKGTQERMGKLFVELKTALRICLVTQSFQPGTYEASAYSNDWRAVE